MFGFLEVINLLSLMSFKSSALFSVLLLVNDWGLDWLVLSHRRISVGPTHDTFWVVTNLVSEH